MAIFTHINTSSRARMRDSNNSGSSDIEDYDLEKMVRKSKLSPEIKAQYERELEERKKAFLEFYKRKGLSSSLMDYYEYEEDFIDGKYLGQDVREFPEYVSEFEKEKREQALSEDVRLAFKKELDELSSNLSPYFQKHKIKDGEMIIRITAAERDFIVGKYLGQDVREFPEYVSGYEREKREQALSEDDRLAFTSELAELSEKLSPYLYEHNIKNEDHIAEIKLKEQDFIIGKYLGQDVRKYPKYVSVINALNEQVSENKTRR